jgi:hypothetical protein
LAQIRADNLNANVGASDIGLGFDFTFTNNGDGAPRSGGRIVTRGLGLYRQGLRTARPLHFSDRL